ncbi:DUF4865 family protein [Sphingomonas sp. GC_Shp_2]|uniref:DUF4865 family protein n=2 Tax=unclassified Sphingomonas TaxID=196159 RepID=UPI00226A14C3|nr:DUF4865 family protein [Sphingomonas sp. GC_Shp_2]
MFLKQYEITLPADYDMAIIRDRVAKHGASFDDFPGLALKCFLIRERGRYGAEANQYAPVYLWPHEKQMWRFLAGPAFAKIKADFGVPPVSTWPGLAFAAAEHLDIDHIASVTRVMTAIPPETDLQALLAREREEADVAVSDDATCLARAVGLDPRTWTLVRFDYWSCPQKELPSGARSYQVLHCSAPALCELGDA